MDITWHGHSCFTIKGKDATIVTDPFEGLGPQLPKLKANIVSYGEGEIPEIEGDLKYWIGPGEFEISNVPIESFSPNGEPINIFIFVLDGIKFAI